MERQAYAHLELDTDPGVQLILSVAVNGPTVSESLTAVSDGTELEIRETLDEHGTRLHLVDSPGGRVVVDYRVEVHGALPGADWSELNEIRYLRPSRYCESDTLGPTARSQFSGLAGADLLAAVSTWVRGELSYQPQFTSPTDGAVRTLLMRSGVCRDYAHLVVALLRALDVPARLVSVYAPGLYPMDFHAVAEAYVDGAWQIVDATGLAPRRSMMRIATGRDAADTAFLTTRRGFATLVSMEVLCVVDELPADDVAELVRLA
ncbi:transglutaminase-like domain-containing protein [Planctomonas deserti]|uniref:transglutaminase-like domain-containing protein n=1 Tax=Planctomonas deserti TaxID=2144185 RepID=UPI000D3AF412|nr:transglutaminase domain-containing protein [Planctomonas deserti]